MRAFIAKYPGSKLLKQAYQTLSYAYSYQSTKEDAAAFFEEYAGKFPDDPQVLDMWLARINRDKGPYDKGAELAARIRALTRSNPVRRYNKDMAEVYANRGEAAKAEEVYGKSFMEGQATSMAIDLIEYAQFWAGREANKDSAVAMAETALKLKPDMMYVIQQAAGVFVKLGREDKAMDVFGPAWLEKNGGTAANHYSYGAFWSGQGKNMDAALAALRKAVAMDPDKYYFWSGLANALQKLKNVGRGYPGGREGRRRRRRAHEGKPAQGRGADQDRPGRRQEVSPFLRESAPAALSRITLLRPRFIRPQFGPESKYLYSVPSSPLMGAVGFAFSV